MNAPLSMPTGCLTIGPATGVLLGLLYPHVGGVRASRLSARVVERAYREWEAAG